MRGWIGWWEGFGKVVRGEKGGGSNCSFRWIHDTPGSERGGKEKDYSTVRRRRKGKP